MERSPFHNSALGQDDAERAADAISSQWRPTPRVAIILGTGLSQFAESMVSEASIPYSQIHGFATTTALSHRGRVVGGQMAGVPLIMFDGRCHLYEGYSFEQVTWPVRVASALGAQYLIVSNASGGLNPQYRSGDVMVIDDHLNLMGMRGFGVGSSLHWDESPVDRPARVAASPYDPDLANTARCMARSGHIPAQRGVYIGGLGPCYETAAEYRFLRKIGGDVVGMSTVPEVTVAAALRMRILGLSVVTNVARPDDPQSVTASDVVDVAAGAARHVRFLVEKILEMIHLSSVIE